MPMKFALQVFSQDRCYDTKMFLGDTKGVENSTIKGELLFDTSYYQICLNLSLKMLEGQLQNSLSLKNVSFSKQILKISGDR